MANSTRLPAIYSPTSRYRIPFNDTLIYFAKLRLRPGPVLPRTMTPAYLDTDSSRSENSPGNKVFGVNISAIITVNRREFDFLMN